MYNSHGPRVKLQTDGIRQYNNFQVIIYDVEFEHAKSIFLLIRLTP